MGLGNIAKNVFTAMTGLSGGDIAQKALEFIGVPKELAAGYGAFRDFKGGNLVGAYQNLTEAMTGFERGKGLGAAALGAMFANKMCGPQTCGAPANACGAQQERIDLANRKGGGLGTLAAAGLGFALGGPLGIGALGGAVAGVVAKKLFGGSVSRSKAKCIEKKLQKDPKFRAQFEAQVGGRYVPDCRRDGKITIARDGKVGGYFAPNLPGLAGGVALGALGIGMLQGTALGGLGQMFNNAGGLIRGFQTARGIAQGGNYLARATMNGVEPSSGEYRIRQNARPGGEVANLPVPATFEDLVAAFMMDVVKDMQDELKQKMAEYDKMGNSDDTKQGPAGGAGGRRRGGLLGGIVGGIANIATGGLFGGLTGLLGGGGSLLQGLTSAVGGPGGHGAGALGGAADQAASAAGGNQGAQGSDEDSRQILFEKIKQLMQQLSAAIQSLSNVLNVTHETATNSIRNIRA